MRRIAVLVSLTLLVSAVSLHAQRGSRSQDARWAHDGVHLVVDGKWIEPESGKEVPAVPPPAEAPKPDTKKAFTEALAAAGKVIESSALSARRARSTLPRAPETQPGSRISSDGQRMAAILDGELWVYDSGGKARKLRDGIAGARHFRMATDGSAVSYILGFDLYLNKTDSGTTFKLSSDGGDELFYGELDWVYQEEVYGRGNFQAAWWAPGGEHLAYLRTEEGGVNTFTVVDHIPNALETEQLKYPKSGTTNPRATLWVARARDGKVVCVDLGAYSAEDEILIVHVGWTPEGDEVVFQVQNREQTWLDLVFADPRTGACRTLVHEEAEWGWVNRIAMPRWLDDGSFLWWSERTGYKHLYRYGRDGKQLAAVTSGDWEVRRIVRLDEAAGWVAYSGTKDSAVGPHVYRSGLDGSGFVRLSESRGSHSVSMNADGSMLIDSYSSLENEGESWLRRADGSAVRQLSRKDTPTDGSPPQLHRIEARDGEFLDVTFQTPKGFDPAKKYPVWIDTYSGPGAATVRDRWAGTSSRWYGDNGIVVLKCNVRSASGRGQKYTARCYKQFGVQELMDLEDAAKWLGEKYAWADLGRLGISGWSYGGFMAGYALTHSKMFKCGVAGAGVYDWELYDTIYTERYMAKPQNNRDGYKRSSVTAAAENLHGELLIVHGTMDDNVHMQNALQFVHALQKANKQNFQFMLYPKSRHGVRSSHLNSLRYNFILEHL